MAEKTTYVIELNDKLSPGLKKAAANAMGLDNAMSGLGKKTKGAGGGMNLLSGALTKLAGPLALAAAGMKAFQFAAESVKVAREFEALENAITFASGSAEKGAENMQYLRDRSQLLGLDMKSTAEGFKQFSGAMIGTSLEGQATRDIFDGIQVASSVMGLSADDAKGAMLALSQMMGKGKVSAEELRGQLGERIPGAFNIAARSMGLTTMELDKMMSNGEIMAEEFLPKFANELKATFGPGLEKAANSGQAQLNRFNNTMLDLKLTLGNALMPAVNAVMSGFSSMVNFLKSNWETIRANILQPFIDHFNTIKNELSLIGDAISEAFDTDGVGIFEGIMQGIGFLLKGIASIAQFAIKVIGTAIRALVDAWSGIFNFFKSPIDNAKKLLNGFANYFGNLFKGISNVVKGVINLDMDQIKSGLREVQGEGLKIAADTKNAVEGYVFKKPKESTVKEEAKNFDEVLKQQSVSKVMGGGTGKDGKKSSTTVDSVKSGRPTNIYIDINKLIETFNVTATNLDDLNNKAKDLVAQALLSAVNNVNYIAR